ncbi:hypothetical protein [Vibrio sp.]|uniref:hypothetical protein n=1 Tax=Vibrio sp. TaxID=678 RepID=UPI003D0DAA15
MPDLLEAQTYIEEDNIPTMIVPLIMMATRDYLEVALQDEIPDNDPTKAVVVKVGRFQDNPVQKNVLVAISGGDYEDPSYLDARADHQSLDQIGLKNLPIGEIGGGTYWWRRFSIDFRTFFVKQRLEEDIAMKYAYEFYGRLLKAVETCTLRLTDSYGEMTNNIPPFIEGASFFESGGPKQYIWRGKLLWRVLTWRP